MKKSMYILIISIFLGVILIGCDGVSTEQKLITTEESELVQTLNYIYNLSLESDAFDGTYEEWLESVRGPQGLPGENGREILLQVKDGYIQWQYIGETEWSNLIDLFSLTGSDGREVEFQVAEGHIQWQYVGDIGWKNLIALDILTGSNGLDGREVSMKVSEGYIQWQYIGDTIWSNLIDLDSLTGSNGNDGREISLQVSDDFIQWQYTGEKEWTNLVELKTITGMNGVDGREVLFQVTDNTLQWKYEGERDWIDLIVYYNLEDDYYLTDNEINTILNKYVEDIEAMFPGIDLSTLSTLSYDNTCDTVDYERCNTSDNYPSIFGNGFELYEDKIGALNILKNALTGVSTIIDEFDSEPIVPGDFVSGYDDYVQVQRNSTSVLFEGDLSGELPIEIPLGIEFAYRLLIYKSVEDNKIYVEGYVNIVGGFWLLEKELASTSYLSTYDMALDLKGVIYTTDFVGLPEWVSILQPLEGGFEMFSTNNEAVEYYKVKDGITEILYSSDWYEQNNSFYYERYIDNILTYIYRNEEGIINYEIPMSEFAGWDVIEYTEDSKFNDNEFLYAITYLDSIVKSDAILETPLLTEPTWILLGDFVSYFNNNGELDKSSAANTIYIETNSKPDLEAFISTVLTYNNVSTFDEHIIVVSRINSFSYLSYFEDLMNIQDIFEKFNLRN